MSADIQSDLLLVVPGLDIVRRGEAIEHLTECLIRYLPTRKDFSSFKISTRAGEGLAEVLLVLKQAAGSERRIEIREVGWTDIRPSMKEASAYIRFYRGARLLSYWTGTLLCRRIPKSSNWLRFWQCILTGFLIFWYLLVILALYKTVSPDFFEMTKLCPAATSAAPDLVWSLKTLLSPKLLSVVAIALLACKVLTDNVDWAWSTFAFMADYESFRRALRVRVRGMLSHAILAEERFERIVLIAHSFGSVVAADALAADDSDSVPVPRLEFVTLGSPLEFLGSCDDRLKGVAERCLGSPAVRSWFDFFARKDAFCSGVPLRDGAGGKFRAQELDLGYSTFKAALGQAHNAYFEHKDVLRTIIG